jgi:hypothetical protein
MRGSKAKDALDVGPLAGQIARLTAEHLVGAPHGKYLFSIDVEDRQNLRSTPGWNGTADESFILRVNESLRSALTPVVGEAGGPFPYKIYVTMMIGENK